MCEIDWIALSLEGECPYNEGLIHLHDWTAFSVFHDRLVCSGHGCAGHQQRVSLAASLGSNPACHMRPHASRRRSVTLPRHMS